jgi:hypothetical protein
MSTSPRIAGRGEEAARSSLTYTQSISMHRIDPIYLEHQLKRWMRPDAHRFIRPDWRRFVRPEFQADHPFALYERKYSADQPRVPAGSHEGGQWTNEGGGGGDEIPTGARPIQFGPSKEGWHHYQEGPNLVCRAELQCTKEEIADQLARYSVPGQAPSSPVEDGQEYAVYDPETGMFGGFVRTTVSEDGMTITNSTLPLHIFYDGVVIRSARQSDDGSWSVTTEGLGNNVVPGASEENQKRGPEIFRSLDERMRANIEQHHTKAIIATPGRANSRRRGRLFWLGDGGKAYAEY